MSDTPPIDLPQPQPDRLPNGRYLPGHRLPGPGRPKGIDFRAVIEKAAADQGRDIGAELLVVWDSMLKRARDGDVNAARFCFGAVVDSDPALVAAGVALRVITGVDE